MSLWINWVALAACAALILAAGTQLSRYGDVIARHTGLGGGWIGLVLMASVTSLPELVTGISAVTIAAVPDIAVGNALGACVLNLAMVVVLDVMHRRQSIYDLVSQGHILGAAFGIVMLGVVAFDVLAASTIGMSWGHVSTSTPLVLVLYGVAIRTIFRYERGAAVATRIAEAVAAPGPELTLRQAAGRYAAASGVVIGAALWLPFVASGLAEAAGWTESFVGTMLVALTTTLPELTVTIASVRLGALDMAIGNLVGSNLFNVAILGIEDLCYREGVLLSAAASAHALSAVAAVVMSGALIVALVARPQAQVLNLVGWTSMLIGLSFFANAWLHYRQGG
jgi:cation:H+ antiporter